MLKKIFMLLLLGSVITTPIYAQKIIGLNDVDRFDDNRDNVVFDRATQLTWQTCSLGQQIDKKTGCSGIVSAVSWDEAKKLEATGWRLPSREELATLISRLRNENKTVPRIDQGVFYRVDKAKVNYWTSDSAGDREAWYVSFGTGPITGKADKNSQFAVRLVKGTFVPPAPEVKPPKDIYEFIGRRDDCNHFGGEFSGEPADRARDEYLNKTMIEMRCNNLELDEKKLRKKYQSKPDMLKWLEDNQKWPR